MSALKLAVAALNRDKPHVSTPHAPRLVPPQSSPQKVVHHRLGRDPHLSLLPRRSLRRVCLPPRTSRAADSPPNSIPELATSISLQSTGYLLIARTLYTADRTDHRPSEASRAIRKKIKHGDNHQKYRALVVRPIYTSPPPPSNPD